jgi:uncharacterized protein with HEPN domain
MSRHDDSVRIQHMIDHAREAIDLASQRTRADLDRDRIFNLAMVRLLEIIGEAAARVTEVGRERYPRVQWPEIVGMRNRIVHGYDQINFDIVWTVITQDLPALLEALK